MLKYILLLLGTILLTGCKEIGGDVIHACDINASPFPCEPIETERDPYLTFNNTTTATATVAEASTTTFTVELKFREPDGTVVVDLTTDDATEGSLSPSSLTYTPSNWETAQTVTVTGPVDNISDGSQTSTITASINDGSTNDDYYDALVDQTLTLTTTDITSDGSSISSTSSSVSETGTTSTFTIALTSSPDCVGNVVLDLTDDDTSDANISYTPTQLTFTSSNWDTAQTVTVTGLNDNVSDGNNTTIITAAPNAGLTCDPDYDGIASTTHTVTTTDDDTPGFTVSESGGSSSTSETGTTDTFTVVLNSEPTSNVRMSASSDDTGEVRVSTSSLTFTASDWYTPQTVTLTGQDDYIVDGTQTSTISVSVVSLFTADTDYSGLSSQTFSNTNTDDDAVGITISHAGANSASTSVDESGTTDNVTVVLDTIPSGNVVLDISSADTGEFTVGTAQLTFTTSNWNVPQTVVVTGIDETDIDGNQTVQFRAAPNGATADADYAALSTATLNVTVVNDDFPPGVNEGFSSGVNNTFSEGGASGVLRIRLDWQPASNVVIEFYSTGGGGDDEVSFSPDNMTFTPANWSTNQFLTVTPIQDNIVDSTYMATVRARAVASATDDAWDSLDEVLYTWWIMNTTQKTWSATETGGSTSVNESGTTDTVSVVGTTQIASDGGSLIVSSESKDTSEFTVSPSSLTFDSTNWNTPQTFTVTGVDDNASDGDITATLRLYANSSNTSPSEDNVTVTTVDDDIITPEYDQLSGSWYHFCARKVVDGTVYCWGRNDNGQLGDGTQTNRFAPVQVTGLSGIVRIEAEMESTCALDNTSELYCWGKFYEGDGSTRTVYTSPQAMTGTLATIPSGTTIFNTSRKNIFTSNGTAHRVIGQNAAGEHGDGTTSSNRTAKDPSWGYTPKEFYMAKGGSGRNNACFSDNATDKLYCMGDGAQYFFQDGATNNTSSPQEMTVVGTTWTDFAMGSQNTFYIDGSGVLYGWGAQSTYGELGLGDYTLRTTSTQISPINSTTVLDVEGSNTHTCVILTDKTVWCVGANAAGQLGNSSTTNSTTWVDTSLTNITDLALSRNASCAIETTSGTSQIFCWGTNQYGEQGDRGQIGGAIVSSPSTQSGWTLP